MCKKSIIVFDSGFGGISVLKRLVDAMPNENYLYYGDSTNAPYGPRSEAEIRDLTCNAIKEAKKQCEPKAIVIACNTATTIAKSYVQAFFPDIPVFGIVPAVEAAVAAQRNTSILVLATAGTISSTAYRAILSQFFGNTEIISVAAPEIVSYVEGGMRTRKEIMESLKQTLAPYHLRKFDGVVLGCTHFPFAADVIEEVLGYPVTFYDGSIVTTRQVMEALETQHLRNTKPDSGSIRIVNSGKQQENVRFSWELFSSKLRI